MPEIKHQFTGGKMNKDVDERLVPNGEYRDAENIQVSTSEGSDVGTVQNILGSEKVTMPSISDNSICVGSIADEKNDAFYWFVRESQTPTSTISGARDIIFEHKDQIVTHVFVDVKNPIIAVYSLQAPASGNIVINSQVGFDAITVGDKFTLAMPGWDGDEQYTVFSKDPTTLMINIGDYTNATWANFQTSGPADIQITLLRGGNVLRLPEKLITGINIVDDMLFWTDGITEPKKINIPRSIEGTNLNGTQHTLLINPEQNITVGSNIKTREEHVTVIRKAPKNALTVEVDTDPEFGKGVTSQTQSWLQNPQNSALGNLLVGDPVITEYLPGLLISHDITKPLASVGDILLFNPASSSTLPPEEYEVSILLNSLINDGSGDLMMGPITIALAGTYQIWDAQIVSIAGYTSSNPQVYNYSIKFDYVDTFKNKFPRFSYRYKYEDGEYSTFAPFTNIIFQPKEDFKYDVKEAYNLAMENSISKVKLYDYTVNLPRDVVNVDILYKESNSPSVYVVDTLKKSHLITGGQGGFEVTPNQIKGVLPSNQLLRAWDNVPRNSLSQEISGNRIIYGNYLQNYNIEDQSFDLNVGLVDRNLCDITNKKKSLKSIRNYSLGVSFLDKYGRQSPVFPDKQSNLGVGIDKAKDNNQLTASLIGSIPDWATHYKIFVKDTSNEYYNLAMDRIYEANDGNIWISFPSSERNKVDDETFLILKKGVEGATPVTEKNKYKILAIENEAPEFIKTKLLNVGKSTSPAVSGSNPIFHSNGWPIAPKKTIHVIATNWISDALPLEDLDLMSVKFTKVLSVSNITVTSELYDVVLFQYDTPFYKLELDKAITEEWLEDTTTSGQPDDTVSMTVYRRSVENSPEFDGRFFVKIRNDIHVNNYISSQAAISILTEQQEVASASFYYFADNNNPYSSDNTTSNIVSGSGTVGGKTDTKDDWDAVLKPTSASTPEEFWFIDAAYYHGTYEADKIQNNGGLFVPDMPAPLPGLFGHGTTHSLMHGDGPVTSGYNKGIEVDGNGQAWIHLSYSSLKMSHDSQNTNTPSGSLHSDTNTGAINLSNTYDIINAQNYATQDIYDIADWGFEELHTAQPGSVDGVGGIKHWTLNSSSFNTFHEDVDVAAYLNESNQFQFEGDEETIYTISGPVTKTYHVNYTGWQESNDLWNIAFEDIMLNGISGMPELEAWWNDAHQFGHPRNRRITYHIPIVSSANVSPIDPNSAFNPIATGNANATTTGRIRFVEEGYLSVDNQVVPEDPAIWETEPKKDIDLDIYYEVDGTFPLEINNETNYTFAPQGSTISLSLNGNPIPSFLNPNSAVVASWEENKVIFSDLFQLDAYYYNNPSNIVVTFHKLDGSCVTAKITSWDEQELSQQIGYPTWPAGSFLPKSIIIEPNVSKQPVFLSWFNCYSFGNGVESNRIRDDYNQIYIDKGAKASSTVDEPYEEEHRKYGLIYSGLYNSTSGVNNLNQFIAAEKITKDINPRFGSIQKLHSRDTDLVTLCEDKCLRILANKDAVYNADGNSQLTATTNVLGQTVPFSGEFGISKNPESFASESYRVYFTDKVRGTVMRLSKDGLTPISMHGMKDWFKDNLKLSNKLIGSYDDKKDEYNITLNDIAKTVSFREDVRGWVSFKSFIPENGISCTNEYYTFKDGGLWKHHIENSSRNTFYGDPPYKSSVNVILNNLPGSVKSFSTLNYEGSQSKVDMLYDDSGVMINDGEYYNLMAKKGWYVESIETDKEKGSISEFIEKEGKWFNYLKGEDIATYANNQIIVNADGSSSFDQASFAIQGIGTAIDVSYSGCMDPMAVNYVPSAIIDPYNTCLYCDHCDANGAAAELYLNANNDLDYNVQLSQPYEMWMMEWVVDGIVSGGVIAGSYTIGDPLTGTIPLSQYIPHVSLDNTINGKFSWMCDGAWVCSLSVTISLTTGCTDPNATNYDQYAIIDDGSCAMVISNNPSWNCMADGSCQDPGDGSGFYSTFAACQAGCPVNCSSLNINYAITPHPMSNLSDGIKVLLQNTGDDLPYTVACLDSQGTTIGDSSGAGGWSSGGTTSQGDIVYFGQGTPLITDTYTIIITTAQGCTSEDTIFIDNS